MFEQHDQARARKLPRYALLSIGAHVAIVLVFGVLALRHPEEAVKPVEVKFLGPGKSGGPPPPPPPAGSKTPKRKKVIPKKIEIPKITEMPKPVEAKAEPPPKPDEPEGEDNGVKGGVKGGVVGGIVGGVVGATGGGGDAGPPPADKPKNVMAFVINKDAIKRPDPHMGEVFRNTHRGQRVTGAYRICIGRDGHIYDVEIVTSIPGADDEFIETFKSDWLYKPQPVPVCFLFNAGVTIQ
jgi:protein TonB